MRSRLVMDHGQLGDVGRVGLIQRSGYDLDQLRDWRWQVWP